MRADGDLIANRATQLGIARLIIGLFQGAILYSLFRAAQANIWPVTDAPLFAPLTTTAVFVPTIVISGLGKLSSRLLLGWTLTATLICASLAWYSIVHDSAEPPVIANYIPSPPLWLALSAGLFIAQSMLVAGAADHRFLAKYATYFDVSWKFGLQLVLATLFAGAFWALLTLGAALFQILRIDFVTQTIQMPWFQIPATTLVLTCAFHVTDVRVEIIRGVRIVGCSLLSWLLPLMTVMVLGFLATLLFTSMDPLWSTNYASLILLAAASSLIFLINSVYQDGSSLITDTVRPNLSLLQISVVTASGTLLPLVLLAGYGVALRVRQYGWTPERIYVTACTIIVACYAAGYIATVARPSKLFAMIQTTNVGAAFVLLTVMLALFSPIADPARISVSNQLHRLRTGHVTPEQFDYEFLRFHAGCFGIEALHELAEQKTLAVAAENATRALQAQSRQEMQRPTRNPKPEKMLVHARVVQPRGQPLPPEFLTKDWSTYPRKYLLPRCFDFQLQCDALVTDLDGDGTDEIILISANESKATVFRKNRDKSWDISAFYDNVGCPGIRDALIAGKFAPIPSMARDLDVAGQRLRMTWLPGCN